MFKLHLTLKVTVDRPQKTIGILTKVFYTSGLKRLMSYGVDKLVIDGQTHAYIYTHTQVTTIPEGKNWPRGIGIILSSNICAYMCVLQGDTMCICVSVFSTHDEPMQSQGILVLASLRGNAELMQSSHIIITIGNHYRRFLCQVPSHIGHNSFVGILNAYGHR